MKLTVTSTLHMCARPLHGACSVRRYKSVAQPRSEQQVTQVKPRSSGHAICCRCVYHRISQMLDTSRESFKKLNPLRIQWLCETQLQRDLLCGYGFLLFRLCWRIVTVIVLYFCLCLESQFSWGVYLLLKHRSGSLKMWLLSVLGQDLVSRKVGRHK